MRVPIPHCLRLHRQMVQQRHIILARHQVQVELHIFRDIHEVFVGGAKVGMVGQEMEESDEDEFEVLDAEGLRHPTLRAVDVARGLGVCNAMSR